MNSTLVHGPAILIGNEDEKNSSQQVIKRTFRIEVNCLFKKNISTTTLNFAIKSRESLFRSNSKSTNMANPKKPYSVTRNFAQ